MELAQRTGSEAVKKLKTRKICSCKLLITIHEFFQFRYLSNFFTASQAGRASDACLPINAQSRPCLQPDGSARSHSCGRSSRGASLAQGYAERISLTAVCSESKKLP